MRDGAAVETNTGEIRLIEGDCLEVMAALPTGGVDCVVTSPPYWGGVRDYGDDGQIGLERRPEDYVAALLEVFRDVRACLRPDGTLWLNVGDVYAASGKGGGGSAAANRNCWDSVRDRKGFRMPPDGYKMKDLTLVAFQLADALRRDGWYLRSTIIWEKTAAVEPLRADRPAVSHEYLFLLSPSEHYRTFGAGLPWWNRTVWQIRSESIPGHPAPMPLELARRCVAMGSEPGDMILDPFAGAGTTLLAAYKAGRKAIGIDLKPEYLELARRRLADAATPLFDALEGDAR